MPRIAASAYVNEAAYISGNVEIGEHSSVWPGASIRGDMGHIVIGEGVSIQDNCVIHSADELIIEDNVGIGHGAVVHCRKIGRGSIVGMGALILHGCIIGQSCIIAAGAIVPPNMTVPDRSMVIGRPGEIKPSRSSGEMAGVHDAEAYKILARQYLDQGL